MRGGRHAENTDFMGIDLNLAVVLDNICVSHRLKGDLLTLGEQTLNFDQAALERALRRGTGDPDANFRQESFFRALGFNSSQSLDITPTEGADHIFDLNSGATPDELRGKYDVVINGGTLEHVFHAPNALANVTRMLRPRGTVIHVTPLNNWVDHGFYQFSPTLLFDYYRAANYELLESILIAAKMDRRDHWFVHPLVEGEVRDLSDRLKDCVCLQVFAARAREHVVASPVPTQRFYQDPQPPRAHTRWFAPFRLENGKATRPQPLAQIDLSSRLEPSGGHAWRAIVPELSDISDNMEHPRRSDLIVLEDGLPIGPPHAAHVEIRELGQGRFSHWGDEIMLSPSDNFPPDQSRRSYTALVSASPESDA